MTRLVNTNTSQTLFLYKTTAHMHCNKFEPDQLVKYNIVSVYVCTLSYAHFNISILHAELSTQLLIVNTIKIVPTMSSYYNSASCIETFGLQLHLILIFLAVLHMHAYMEEEYIANKYRLACIGSHFLQASTCSSGRIITTEQIIISSVPAGLLNLAETACRMRQKGWALSTIQTEGVHQQCNH